MSLAALYCQYYCQDSIDDGTASALMGTLFLAP